MGSIIIKVFGNTVSNMFVNGLSSGWPFIIFVGIILGFWVLINNGEKINEKFDIIKNKLNLENNKYYQMIERVLQR